MTRTVLIIGTDHRFQTRSPDFAETQHEQFSAFLSATASANGVVALAEEHNIAALAESNIVESTVKATARALGLKHRYCDPDKKKRVDLGILQENEIRVSAFPNWLSEAEVQQRFEESMRAREAYWLSELIDFNSWPVLFVCGANHALSFLDLLRAHAFDGVIVSQDWGA